MMTQRARVGLSLRIALGIVLVGLGHYYAAAWRAIYPLDGYVYYLFAALSFIWSWRTTQPEQTQPSTEFRLTAPGTWRSLLETPRRVVSTVAVLNVAAAMMAVLLSGVSPWLWGVPWVLSALVLFLYNLPASSLPTAPLQASPQPAKIDQTISTRTYVETAQTTSGRTNPIGLAISIGLLLLGQLLVGTLVEASGASSIAQSINETLRLDLVGDPTRVLGGALLLVLGVIGYAVVTRRLGLRDAPVMTATESTVKGARVPWGWLVAALLATLMWLGALSNLASNGAGWSGVPLVIASLVLMAACWWQIDRVRGVRHGLHLSRVEALALGAALVALLLVFAFRLGDVPNSIWGDEGAFLTTARDIAQHAFTPDFFGLGTYALPMSVTVYQSLWLSLLGVNLTAWRFASVFAVWLAAVPLYFLVRSTLGRRVAWVSLALYATLPYLLTYARMGYDSALGIAPVVTALAFTWLAVRRDSRFYAFLAGCAAGLGFYTSPAARISLVLVPGWLLWMWIARRVSGRLIGRQLLTVLLGSLLIAAPPIVYDLTHVAELYAGKQFESAFNNLFYAHDLFPQDQLTTNGPPLQVGQQQLINAPELYGPLLARGAVRTGLALQAGSYVHENFLTGALADPLGILYLLGVAWCVARLRRPGYAVWPWWLMAGGFLTSGLSAYPPRAALMAPVIPAIVVLGALGVVSGFDVLSSVLSGIHERVMRYAMIGTVAVLALAGLWTYFGQMPQRFPPDLANAMFWQAQSLPAGSSLVLVLPDTWPADYQPWGLREFGLPVQFHALTKTDLNTADWHSLCPAACRIFFAAADRDWVVSFLAQAFGDRPLVEYRDSLGGVQAYMLAQK